MKKCIVCKKEILSKAIICPYCSAKQEENGSEQLKKDATNGEEQGLKVIQEIPGELFDVLKEAKVEKISDIPKEVKTEKISNESKEVTIEKAFDIPKEKVEEEENKTSDAEKNQFPKRCSVCGEILNDEDKFCAGCGTKVKTEESKIENKIEAQIRKMKGILKYYGIICGVIFAFFALIYLPWLLAYSSSAKLCGFLMIVACLWSAFISFMIAFGCQKQYGKHLLYALAGGAILKIILHFIRISPYNVMITISFGSIINVLLTAVVVVLYYYIMKVEEMILMEDQKPVQQIVKEIPEVLRDIINTRKNYVNSVNNNTTAQCTPSTLHEMISGRVFLALCITYTINLLYEVIAGFSLFTLLTHTLSILVCFSIWLIYYHSRQKELYTKGVSIILVTTYIRLGIRALGGIVVLFGILGLSSGVNALLKWAEADMPAEVSMTTGVLGVGLFIFIALWILYWYSLSNIILDTKKFFNGEKRYIKVGWYPVVVLGLVVAAKSIWFVIIAYLQYLANQAVDTIDQFGEETSSTLRDIFQTFGLGEYAHDKSSAIIHGATDPITRWIQNTFGFSKNPIFMIIAIAIPVLEIIVLFKIRTLMQGNLNRSSN